MIARPFEVKIALLGNVSAGKTTVLNALLRDKFGEASMKRTTAGINYFRVHASVEAEGAKSDVCVDSSKTSEIENEQPEKRSAKSVLEEIEKDNVKLRAGDLVQEKYFDVELKKDIVTMRKDTKLVLVDIPGINEAGVVNKYKDFVSEKWDEFDCVVVVMDGKQGVNTEDQIFLLKLVKDNLKKKDVPVIILCNKVDDPDDEEQAELVNEARKEVEKIFSVGCRTKALDVLLGRGRNMPARLSMSPAFMTFSAIHAYIHQSASLMSRKKFEGFDKDLIEKLGREQIGRRRWNRLSAKEKLDEAYKVVTEGHQDGIEDSNFDKLVASLRYFLGGNDKQHTLIEKQIEIAIGALTECPGGNLTSAVRSVYERSKLLGASAGRETSIPGGLNLVVVFWEAYSKYEDSSFEMFGAAWPKGFGELAGPMDELIEYQKLASLPDWDDSSNNVVERMKSLVRRLFECLIERQVKARDANGWELKGNAMKSAAPNVDLLPHDWSLVWGSLLLLGCNEDFCESFPREKIICEHFFHDTSRWSQLSNHNDTRCPHCQSIFRVLNQELPWQPHTPWCQSCYIIFSDKQTSERVLCPQCRSYYLNEQGRCDSSCRQTFTFHKQNTPSFHPRYNDEGVIQFVPNTDMLVELPESMAESSHVAHIAWRFCRFMNELEPKPSPLQQPTDVSSDGQREFVLQEAVDDTAYTATRGKSIQRTAKHKKKGAKPGR